MPPRIIGTGDAGFTFSVTGTVSLRVNEDAPLVYLQTFVPGGLENWRSHIVENRSGRSGRKSFPSHGDSPDIRSQS